MKLRLVREPSVLGVTLGVLFVNGTFECWILEDQIREQPGRPVSTWKVATKTAIPAGRYRIIITDSVRFKRRLPLIVGVPGFDGVRIHPGNSIEDTEGCLLPGRVRSVSKVGESKLAFDKLFAKIDAALSADEAVWIDVENPRDDGMRFA